MVITEQPSPAVLDRARGTLLGQAIGDALGTTVEFQTRERIAQTYPKGLRDLVGGGPFHLLPGQITDDTELALALARSLAHCRRYDDDDVARAYVDWFRSHPFDVGGTTAIAFGLSHRDAQGLAATMRAGASTTSQANGSLMRQSPLGVFGWCMEPQALADLAGRDSALSHPHVVCQESCVALTHAIARAIRTGASATEVYDETVRFMTARPTARSSGVLDVLAAASTSAPAEFQHQMGWVLIALQNAFFRLLHSESFEQGVVQTVHCGGDTDTNACIAGALLGAVAGMRSIPTRWIDTLLACRTPRPRDYQCHDLLDLAERLVESGAQEIL